MRMSEGEGEGEGVGDMTSTRNQKSTNLELDLLSFLEVIVYSNAGRPSRVKRVFYSFRPPDFVEAR